MAEIKSLLKVMDTRLTAMDTRLTGMVTAMDTRLTARLDTLTARTTAGFASLRAELFNHIVRRSRVITSEKIYYLLRNAEKWIEVPTGTAVTVTAMGGDTVETQFGGKQFECKCEGVADKGLRVHAFDSVLDLGLK